MGWELEESAFAAELGREVMHRAAVLDSLPVGPRISAAGSSLTRPRDSTT
jgi:hypothetical protein